MVDPVPRPEEARGAVWVHGWDPYEDYRNVHERYMNNLLNEGLVINDGLFFHEYKEDG